MALGLAGCETANSLSASLFGSSNDAPTASVASPPPLAAAAKGAQIAIAPVIGPPENVSGDLRNQLIADMERQGIRVAKTPDEKAEYTLRGYVVSSLEKKGTKSKVSYIWDVTDANGKGVHRVSGEESAPSGKSKDPWTAVSPQIVQSIATKTVSSVASFLPTAGSAVASSGTSGGLVQTAATTPSMSNGASPAGPPRSTGSIGRTGAVKALVPSVTGAPGDGSTTLRAALQRELTRSGIALTESPSPDTYTVEGKVAMGSGKDGKQPITIDWSVTDPSGKKLGTVSQKNEVPQGSLDGSWGKTADAAAAAAAQGIIKLLPQATQTTSSN